MSKYKVIAFDLDDTLIDNRENIKYAFKKIIDYRKEKFTDDLFNRFEIHDKNYWGNRAKNEKINQEVFESNEKKAEHVRAYRFIEFFNDLSYEDAVKINDIYMEALKEKIVTIDGAYDLLKYLKDKDYKIAVATNGPTVAIESKLKTPGLYDLVDVIFSADEVGSMKPNEKFFNGLIDKIGKSLKTNIDRKDIILVGDEIDKDLKGGFDNNIDVCLFKNRKTNIIYDKLKIKDFNPKYEIESLKELESIF